jgi:hypothetical protein
LKEPLGLIHVNFFIQTGIQEGAVNISLLTVEVELGHKGEDDTEGGELDGGGEGLIEVETMDMREALTAETRFVASNVSIRLSFGLDNPFAFDGFPSCWQADKLPSLARKERFVF